LYSSSTSTNVPLAANLTNSTNGAELAINIADKNLFFKDSGGTVNTVPIRQSGTSSNGWLSNTDWNTFNSKAPATSGTSILYGNGSGGFSNVTIGSGISFAGGTLSATGSGGTVTSVTGTAPVVSSGGTTPAISMPAATTSVSGYLTNTDWNTFNSKQPAGTYVTSVGATSPVTSSGGTNPTIAMPAATTSVSGYLTSTDWNTFNNKGSGTVTSVTGTAPVVSSGGATPAISMAAATSSVNGYLTSTDWTTFNSKQPAGSYLTAVSVVSANGFAGTSSGGTTPALTLSTSITGILKGNGTAISAATSGTDYAPATSGSSILYGNGAGGFSNVTVGTGLTFVGGTLASTASGGTVTSVAASVPAFLSITGSPITTSGTLAISYSGTALPVANGGTGLTTLTAGYIPYGNGTSAFSSASNLSFNGSKLTVTSTAAGDAFQWTNAGSTPKSGYFYSDSNIAAIFNTAGAGAGRNGMQLGTNFVSFDIAAAEAGRFTATGGFCIGNTTDPGAGNLQFTTAGTNGVKFGTGTLLTSYEEGTWTPTITSSTGSLTAYTSAGSYRKIGKVVVLQGWFSITTAGTAAGSANIASLPYISLNSSSFAGTGTAIETNNTGFGYYVFVSSNATTGVVNNATNTGLTWAAGYKYVFTLTYQTAA
jgi:hypothetical protein